VLLVSSLWVFGGYCVLDRFGAWVLMVSVFGVFVFVLFGLGVIRNLVGFVCNSPFALFVVLSWCLW